MSTAIPLIRSTRVQTVLPVRVTLSLLSALSLILYGPVLKGLASDWLTDADYAYGFLVPVFALYVVWDRRDRYLRIPFRPSNAGLPVMTASLALLVVGTLGADLYLSRISLPLWAAGMVVYLFGWTMLRAVAFPLSFLALMVPLPQMLYQQATLPLQSIASRLATAGLELLNVPVLREGNLLSVAHNRLEVAQACSGIRSLLSLFTMTVAYLYLVEHRRWPRFLTLFLVVPVAICSNAVRIAFTGLMTYRSGSDWAEGTLHTWTGWGFYVLAFSMIVSSHWAAGTIQPRREEVVHA